MSPPNDKCPRCGEPMTYVIKMSGGFLTCEDCDQEFQALRDRITELENQLEAEKAAHQATYSIMMTAGRAARDAINHARFMAKGWRKKMLYWKERHSIATATNEQVTIDLHTRLVRAEEAILELSSRPSQNSDEVTALKKERDDALLMATMADSERSGLLQQVEALKAKLAEKENP